MALDSVSWVFPEAAPGVEMGATFDLTGWRFGLVDPSGGSLDAVVAKSVGEALTATNGEAPIFSADVSLVDGAGVVEMFHELTADGSQRFATLSLWDEIQRDAEDNESGAEWAKWLRLLADALDRD